MRQIGAFMGFMGAGGCTAGSYQSQGWLFRARAGMLQGTQLENVP